jgi:type II secretory pathway pseudopilin PulG
VLVTLVVVALAALVPTVNSYVAQRQKLSELQSQVAQQQDEVEDLRTQVARWEDPTYVAARARERLLFAMPGETRRSSGPVRLSDPGFQASSEDAETPTQGQGSRSSSASAQGSRRTKPGLTDGARFALRNAEDQEPTEGLPNDAGFARRR